MVRMIISPLRWALATVIVTLSTFSTVASMHERCSLSPSLCQEVSNFLVVLDAGSTGTRAHLYYYPKRELQPKYLPLIVTGPITLPTPLGHVEVYPGISAFVYNHQGLDTYFDPLFDEAARIIREHEHGKSVTLSHVPLYLGATAGMRQLREEDSDALMGAVNRVLKGGRCPFGYRRKEQARILSGEEEGAFAWLSVNALHAVISPSPWETLGALDMGGASAQVAFVPEETSILAGFFPMHFGGAENGPIHLFTHSFLKFGKVAAFQRSADSLLAVSESSVIEHPCMPRGVMWRVAFDEFGVSTENPHPERSTGPVELQGASNFTECRALCRSLLPREPCFQPPCTLAGVYTPRIGNSRFALIGGYSSVLESIEVKPGEPVLQALMRWLAAHCDKPLIELPTGFDSMQCWIGTWAHTFLVDGLGFSLDSMDLHLPVPTPEWALGQAIYEINFFPYEVTTRTGALLADVGFPVTVTNLPTYTALVTGALGFLAGLAVMNVVRPRSAGARSAPLLLG